MFSQLTKEKCSSHKGGLDAWKWNHFFISLDTHLFAEQSHNHPSTANCKSINASLSDCELSKQFVSEFSSISTTSSTRCSSGTWLGTAVNFQRLQILSCQFPSFNRVVVILAGNDAETTTCSSRENCSSSHNLNWYPFAAVTPEQHIFRPPPFHVMSAKEFVVCKRCCCITLGTKQCGTSGTYSIK